MPLLRPLNPPFASYTGRRVWVIGASSGIGAAVAAELIGSSARVALSARDEPALRRVAADHTGVCVAPADVTDSVSLRKAAQRVESCLGGIDLVLMLAGTHVEMQARSWELQAARQLIEVNLLGVFNVLDVALPMLQRAGPGAGIAIVSSVAGYVGLPRALVYGPSKAALINLCECLYGDLHPAGLGVYLISPGFVDTRLTRRNDFRMPALTQPVDAARRMLADIAAGRFESHFPRRFTWWLKALRLLPYRWQFFLVRSITAGT